MLAESPWTSSTLFSVTLTLFCFSFSGAHGRPVWSCFLKAGETVVVRGSLLQVLNCVGPKPLGGHRKHCTLLNNVITENSWKTGVAVIRRVVFSIVICYRALRLSSCLRFEGTFFGGVCHPFRSIFTISDSPLLPLLIPVCLFFNPLCRFCPPCPLFWLIFRGTQR